MDQSNAPFRRRTVLGFSAAAGTALASTAQAADGTNFDSHQDPGNCSTPRSAIAGTLYGPAATDFLQHAGTCAIGPLASSTKHAISKNIIYVRFGTSP